MASVEAQLYQTRQDGQETPVKMWLGDLLLQVHPGLVRAFLVAQVPYITQVASDPKSKTLRLAFKAAAKLAMDFYVIPKARRGEMPLPDERAMRADILGYSVMYWTDLVLLGLASQPWELLYVEQTDGSLEITGLAPADESTSVDAEAADAAQDENAATADTAAGQGDAGSTLGALVSGGHDGERQDDICETPAGGAAPAMA